MGGTEAGGDPDRGDRMHKGQRVGGPLDDQSAAGFWQGKGMGHAAQ